MDGAFPHSADGPARDARETGWTPDRIQTFLGNEKFIGEYAHGGARYKTTWPAIVDCSTWNAFVRVRMRALKPPRVHRRYRNYILTGTLRCGRRGAPCRGFTHKEKRRAGAVEWAYYVCATLRGRGLEACGERGFRQLAIDDETLKVLRPMVVPGLADAVDAAIKSYVGQARRAARQTRRRNVDERLMRLAELYEMGDIPKAAYIARKNELLIERDQLEAQPAATSIALQSPRHVRRGRLGRYDRGREEASHRDDLLGDLRFSQPGRSEGPVRATPCVGGVHRGCPDC